MFGRGKKAEPPSFRPPSGKSEADWRAQLTQEEYYVLRQKGTERAFTGEYWDAKAEGTYICRGCGCALFDSAAKFDSGTGWPSFYAPVTAEAVATEEDRSLFMRRVEALCANCGSHLGHVFPDGPRPTGMRYCMNSLSLRLKPRSEG